MSIPQFSYKSARADVRLIALGTTQRPVYRIVNLHSKEQRQGHATQLMWEIVEWADRKDALLTLVARPYRHPSIGLLRNRDDLIDLRSLIKFYEKFGFVEDTNSSRQQPYMRRVPRES